MKTIARVSARKTLQTVLVIVLGAASLVSATPRGRLENSDPTDPYGRKEDSRPPFMIPEGTTNLALRKKVTSSSLPTGGVLETITDGTKDYFMGVVVLKEGEQWVQIDLGQTSVIYAIIFWLYDETCHFYSYNDVVVQVSDDPEFKKDVKILFNNDHDNSSGFGVGKNYNYWENYLGKLVDAKGVPARYVRINTNGNNLDQLNRFTAVDVWGLVGKTPSEKLVPLVPRYPKPLFK
ncbi:MAG: hypothetical protein WA117_15865 [Verrucomicrobiia bacterium]